MVIFRIRNLSLITEGYYNTSCRVDPVWLLSTDGSPYRRLITNHSTDLFPDNFTTDSLWDIDDQLYDLWQRTGTPSYPTCDGPLLDYPETGGRPGPGRLRGLVSPCPSAPTRTSGCWTSGT